MRKYIIPFVFFVSNFLSIVNASPIFIPAPPEISASSYILMDAYTGDVLAQKNSDQELPPASLTKLMTAYIAEYEMDRGDISNNDMVQISEKAWRMKGSRMFIREGTRVSMNDLMQGIIVQSGNDASVAVAEHIAGSESAFADLMNQHAKLLGLRHTHFVNSTGYPAEGHVSSAHDIALIAQATITQFPENYTIYSEKYFTYNKIRQPNRNRLLWRDKTVDGLKTGHTDAAGFCLAASALRNSTRLIAVVFGAKTDESRAEGTQKLLDYGFRYFETRKLYSKGQTVSTIRIWGGTQDTLKVGVIKDVYMTLPRQSEDTLPAMISIHPKIDFPIKIGDVLGTITITTAENVSLKLDLLALEAVQKGSLLKRAIDGVKHFFN